MKKVARGRNTDSGDSIRLVDWWKVHHLYAVGVGCTLPLCNWVWGGGDKMGFCALRVFVQRMNEKSIAWYSPQNILPLKIQRSWIALGFECPFNRIGSFHKNLFGQSPPGISFHDPPPPITTTTTTNNNMLQAMNRSFAISIQRRMADLNFWETWWALRITDAKSFIASQHLERAFENAIGCEEKWSTAVITMVTGLEQTSLKSLRALILARDEILTLGRCTTAGVSFQTFLPEFSPVKTWKQKG